MKTRGSRTAHPKKIVKQEKKGTTQPTKSTMTQIPKIKYGGKSHTEVKGQKKDVYVEKKYKTKVEQGLNIIKSDSKEIIDNNKIKIKNEEYIPYSCIEKLEENDMTCDEKMLE